jgi:hypothetical protein
VGLVSFLLAGVLVFGIYRFQLSRVDAEMRMSVIVPARFIDAGTLLSEDMLKEMPWVKGAFQEGMFVRREDLIGRETMIALGRDEPVLEWKLDDAHLLPDEGELTFQIPKAYILSLSNGIRAGDQVHLYLSGAGGSKAGTASGKLFGRSVTVASVKSADNLEVDSVEDSALLSRVEGNREKLYAARRDANGAIEHINLNLTEEQWQQIDAACGEQQAKLVIAYASSYRKGAIHD